MIIFFGAKKMAVTIKDVAKHAGVSVCTVSRVLNNTYRNKVSAQTRKRVLEVSEELGYRPSIIARGLKGKTTNLVGYVVPNVASSFLANTLMGIQKTAEDYGYSILVYTTMGDIAKDIEYLRILKEKRVDGILWLPLQQIIHDIYQEVAEETKLIQIYNSLEGIDAPSFLVDHYKGGYLATKHLLEKGHTKIAHLSAPNTLDRHGLQRLSGYKQALEEKGIKPDDSIIVESGYSWQGGYKAAKSLFSKPYSHTPTAIFAVTDMVAWGALRYIKEKGMKIPEDVAIVGYDNLDIAEKVDPPLTTVSQPKEELGKIAMDHLLQAIRGKPISSMLFDPELVVRSST